MISPAKTFYTLDCQFTNVTFPPSLNSLKIIIQKGREKQFFISIWQNNRYRPQAVGIEYSPFGFYLGHMKVINKSLNRNSSFLLSFSPFLLSFVILFIVLFYFFFSFIFFIWFLFFLFGIPSFFACFHSFPSFLLSISSLSSFFLFLFPFHSLLLFFLPPSYPFPSSPPFSLFFTLYYQWKKLQNSKLSFEKGCYTMGPHSFQFRKFKRKIFPLTESENYKQQMTYCWFGNFTGIPVNIINIVDLIAYWFSTQNSFT